MKAPDKIYLDPGFSGDFDFATWDTGKKLESDVEYIRKDALLEWAEKEQAKCSDDTHPYAMFMNVVIDKLNEM